VTFGVEREEHILGDEVDVLTRVQTEVRSTQQIVLAREIPMPYRRHEPRRASDGDIKRLVPSRIGVVVDRARLGIPITMFVREDDEAVGQLRRAVRHGQTLGEDDLDAE
jgi:hypothetical protein